MSKKTMSIFMLLVFTIVNVTALLGCSNQHSNNHKTTIINQSTKNNLKKYLSSIYVEDDKYATFLNKDAMNPDAVSTYNALLIKNFIVSNIQINKTKLKNFVLTTVYRSLIVGKMTRELTEEKYLIDLLSYLNLKLDESTKEKIIKNLNKEIIKEYNAPPSDKNNQMSVKINKQYKMQIYSNYIYIRTKLGYPKLPKKVYNIIKQNYMETEKLSNKADLNTIKAIYYDYVIRNALAIYSSKSYKDGILSRIKKLRTSDDGYASVPPIKFNRSQGDVFSSKMAFEILFDLQDQIKFKYTEYSIDNFLASFISKHVKINNYSFLQYGQVAQIRYFEESTKSKK